MEEAIETESTDMLTARRANITTAQLREAVQRALAAIDSVRALVDANHLSHVSEWFVHSALMTVEGPLYITDLGGSTTKRRTNSRWT